MTTVVAADVNLAPLRAEDVAANIRRLDAGEPLRNVVAVAR
jgi:hypothetical protein